MRFTGLLVALLSIKLEYRGKDVGTALIGEDFECAVQKGYKAAFLIEIWNIIKSLDLTKRAAME